MAEISGLEITLFTAVLLFLAAFVAGYIDTLVGGGGVDHHSSSLGGRRAASNGARYEQTASRWWFGHLDDYVIDA